MKRLEGLDRLRGLAVLLMVLDHVVLLSGVGAEPVRVVARVAMPVFAVLCGALGGHWRWRRWLGWALLGWALCWAPWLDDPNILVWLAVGSGVLAFFGRENALWVVGGALVVVSNGWRLDWGSGFVGWGVVGLVALGAVVGPGSLEEVGVRLPEWLAGVGRRALWWYGGHVVVLEVVRQLALG